MACQGRYIPVKLSQIYVSYQKTIYYDHETVKEPGI